MATSAPERWPLWKRFLAFVGWTILTAAIGVAAATITQVVCLDGVRC
jgi:hypothetical protein